MLPDAGNLKLNLNVKLLFEIKSDYGWMIQAQDVYKPIKAVLEVKMQFNLKLGLPLNLKLKFKLKLIQDQAFQLHDQYQLDCIIICAQRSASVVILF